MADLGCGRRSLSTRAAAGVVGALVWALAGVGCGTRPAEVAEEAPPLHRAAARGELAPLRAAETKALGAGGPHGFTPLHYAAIHGQAAAVDLLLRRGAPLEARDEVGMTPLHWAARKGRREAVSLLLSREASVQARNRFLMTPLHEASTEAVAELLLRRGARLDVQDVDGMTPLHTAPNRMVAHYYIKRGAPIEARARDGRTPLSMPPAVRPRTR